MKYFLCDIYSYMRYIYYRLKGVASTLRSRDLTGDEYFLDKYNGINFHTVLIATGNPEEYSGHGTGVLVKYKGNYFVLTAGHVINTANDIYLLITPSGFQSPVDKSLTWTFFNEDQSEDIGIIRLHDHVGKAMEIKHHAFLNIEKKSSKIQLGSIYTLTGFPKYSKRQKGGKTALGLERINLQKSGDPGLPCSRIKALQAHHIDLSLTKDVTILPDMSEISFEDALSGFSGGGVWVNRENGQPDLVGIYNGTSQKFYNTIFGNGRFLRATKVEKIIEKLETVTPRFA